MSLFTDNVTAGLQVALDGVAAQQRMTAANIANAATPGYRAQSIQFEGDLASAMAAGQPESAGFTTVDAGTPAQVDGNTVAMNVETTNLTKESLQYQSLVQAMTFKLGLFKTAITGS